MAPLFNKVILIKRHHINRPLADPHLCLFQDLHFQKVGQGRDISLFHLNRKKRRIAPTLISLITLSAIPNYSIATKAAHHKAFVYVFGESRREGFFNSRDKAL
jgi:hypothetical protein